LRGLMNISESIYLDYNVFKYLKTPRKEKETIDKIFSEKINFIKSNKGLILYSRIHLLDLKKGDYKSEEIRKLIDNDLGHISKVTDNYCAYYDTVETIPVVKIIDPILFFDELIEDDDDTYNNMNKLLNGEIVSDIPEIEAQYNQLREQFKVEIDNPFYGQEMNVVPDYFKPFATKPKISYKDMFEQGILNYKLLTSNPLAYKELRKKTNSIYNFGLETENFISQESVDKYLLGKPLGKTFLNNLKQMFVFRNKDFEKSSLMEKIQQSFILLDMYGIAKEKISNKNHFPNITDDALHASIAAYCKLFILEDEHAYKKTKLIYQYFNVATNVMKIDEFNNV
jgi:hypothetical protein